MTNPTDNELPTTSGPEYEYQRFGDSIIRRLSADYEWEEVPADDLEDARIQVGVAERLREYIRSNPQRLTAEITRGPGNEGLDLPPENPAPPDNP